MSGRKKIRFVFKLATLIGVAACQTAPKADIANPHPDALFHKLATHHQSLISSLSRTANISYEDAAFKINRHHRKEARRVKRCAQSQEGFEQHAIYQIPPRYELHFYFKNDAVTKLSNCTHDPLFIAHNVKYGADELKTVFDQAKNLLASKNIPDYSEIVGAGHTLYHEKPDSTSILSEYPYVRIAVDKQNLERARMILMLLMTRHEFLFVVEGHPIDEILVETSN